MRLIFIFNGKMKGVTSTFMGWTVTKLDFDEDTEGPVLPQSPLQPVGDWPAPQSGPVPQR